MTENLYSSEQITFSVTGYNVAIGGYDRYRQTGKPPRLERIKDVVALSQVKPDILILSETLGWPEYFRSNNELLDYFGFDFGTTMYLDDINNPDDFLARGAKTILSMKPASFYKTRTFDRNSLIARISLTPDITLEIASVYLRHSSPKEGSILRYKELEALVAQMPSHDPHLLLGDFNFIASREHRFFRFMLNNIYKKYPKLTARLLLIHDLLDSSPERILREHNYVDLEQNNRFKKPTYPTPYARLHWPLTTISYPALFNVDRGLCTTHKIAPSY